MDTTARISALEIVENILYFSVPEPTELGLL